MFQIDQNFGNSSIFAYLLVEQKSLKILDANNLARVYYKDGSEFPSLKSIFMPTADDACISTLSTQLESEHSIIFDGITSTKASGEVFPCYLEICKLSGGHLFFVIKAKIRNKKDQLEDVVELRENPIFVLNPDQELSIDFGNQRFFQRTHVDKKQNADTLSFLQLLPEESRTEFRNLVEEEIDRYGECNIDIELTQDGQYYQLFRFSAYQSLMDNKLYGVLISAKKQSELMKKIEYDQQYFNIMQQYSKDLLFRIDMKKRTLVHRGDISKLMGLSAEMTNFPECIKEIDLVHPQDIDGYIAFAYRLMGGSNASYEPRFQFTNGTYEKYQLQGSPLFDSEGNTVQVVGKCENIQKLIDIEEKANYDALTTAFNKQSFRELVCNVLSRATDQDKYALLFLDLDNFKGINDSMGHVFGDFLLEACGKRILNCIRKQDKLGRVGGDEFVIFFQFAPSEEAVLERAEAILHSLRREFNHEGDTCRTRASIGVALYPEHGDDYDKLYHHADKALYQSKARGKDIATVYRPEFG